MADDVRIHLSISAFPDGATTYIVTIEEPDTGRKYVLDGVESTSEEDAINSVIAMLMWHARAAKGDGVQFSVGPLEYD